LANGNPVAEQEVPMSTVQLPHRTRKPHKQRKAPAPPAVSAERVREMLREIAFILHTTRIVGRRDVPVAPRKG
jgi:hypothetical protein